MVDALLQGAEFLSARTSATTSSCAWRGGSGSEWVRHLAIAGTKSSGIATPLSLTWPRLTTYRSILGQPAQAGFVPIACVL